MRIPPRTYFQSLDFFSVADKWKHLIGCLGLHLSAMRHQKYSRKRCRLLEEAAEYTEFGFACLLRKPHKSSELNKAASYLWMPRLCMHDTN